MKSLDIIKAEKEAIVLQMNNAIQANDAEAFSEAFNQLTDNIEKRVLAQAEASQSANDVNILASRGTRQLTREERNYYSKAIAAMQSTNPKQALTEIDVVLPKTVIDEVFDDLRTNHPLLAKIKFQNTYGIIEFITNSNGQQEATWGKLCDKIIKELSGSFKKVDTQLYKLSAWMPVCKAMLDLGPQWLDRYVREVLYEALANGLENGIIAGDGNEKPIGMICDITKGKTNDGVTTYPEKEAVSVTSLDQVEYGKLLGAMAVNDKGKSRLIKNVILLVNPVDYLTKIMPATTVLNAAGTYVSNVLPFPTEIIQSNYVPQGKAVLGLADFYFMGAGMGKEGKIEYSDEYKFLEDERTYLIKLYANGFPKDNKAFTYLDISGLNAGALRVQITNAAPQTETPEIPQG